MFQYELQRCFEIKYDFKYDHELKELCKLKNRISSSNNHWLIRNYFKELSIILIRVKAKVYNLNFIRKKPLLIGFSLRSHVIWGRGFPFAGHFNWSLPPTDSLSGTSIELRISVSFNQAGGDAESQIWLTNSL